ncbi:MAG: hypothetical protein L0Y44_14330 [Phycisphaerales bacterium]|nr:hypothetical protein [Phycisphaerales bacterium]
MIVSSSAGAQQPSSTPAECGNNRLDESPLLQREEYGSTVHEVTFEIGAGGVVVNESFAALIVIRVNCCALAAVQT